MPTTSPVAAGFGGCEFATFRARAGVDDAVLLAACARMRAEFLEHEPGFVDHALLKGDGGAWADVVFAQTQADAERICQNFMNNPACLAYLQLIEDGSAKLTFWSRQSGRTSPR